MDSLDAIKLSLHGNVNLTDEIKNRILNLIINFTQKINGVDLTKLNDNLKTVKIQKIGKYEKKGTYYYDAVKNEIQLSNDIDGNYDVDHIFTKAILEMATNTGKFTGFNSDERLMALNLAYTEILANYIIGNEGDSDLEEEMLLANLLSHIVGKDTMFNSYFTNSGDAIIKAMQDAEVGAV